MNPQETAQYLIKKYEFIPINNWFGYEQMLEIRKVCALITATEIQSCYEIKHDPTHYLFWEKVIKQLI